MKQILLIDDHPSVLEGTKVMLEQEGDFIVYTAINEQAAIKLLNYRVFDILLIDLNMPGKDGIELSRTIIKRYGDTLILLYTGYDIEPHFNRLMDAGITGYIPKTASRSKLVAAIRSALQGDTVIPTSLFKKLRKTSGEGGRAPIGDEEVILDDKERFILQQVARGRSNKEIAELLICSQRALEYSLTALYQKLGVKSRREAVIKARQLGILKPGDVYWV